MTNQKSRRNGGTPDKTLFDYASDGVTFDSLPEETRKEVRRADAHKDERDALAEIRTDQLFAEASGVIVDLMRSNEPMLQLKAATEVFRLRAVTLKANKKRQTAESVAKRIYDGFTFGGSGNETADDGDIGV